MASELRAHRLMVLRQELSPSRVAQLRRPGRRADDVRHEKTSKHSVVSSEPETCPRLETRPVELDQRLITDNVGVMTGRNVEDVVWTKVERGSILELDPHPTDTAARIMALAHPGEIWVSETTRVLAAGSGITFEDRGDHELKGIEGSRRLFALSAAADPSSA